MGLFHDKCTALVDAVTGRALTGNELAEAREQQRTFFSGHTLASGKKWRICGNSVSKKAHCCSKCGTRAPGGWVKCPACHEWIGDEDRFCPHCDHPLHPEERVDFAGGIWDREPGLFAQRFEITDGAKITKQGVHIQEGTVAVLLDSGKETGILGPGRHEPDGTLRKINWFGAPPPRSVLLVDSGDVVFKIDIDGLRTAEERPIRMTADVTLRFVPSRADDFIANFFKDSRSISCRSVGEWISNESEYAAKNLCIKTTVDDLVKDPNRRTMFEDELARTVRELLKRTGLELVRVGCVDFVCADYEELRSQYADLEEKRRHFEFDQKLLELVALQKDTETAQSAEAKDKAIAVEHADIERGDADAEFKAKKEQELSEYLEQLAQEKEISGIDRSEEMKIIKMVSAGKLSAKMAEMELTELQQAHAQEMVKIANAHKVEMTNIANEHEADMAKLGNKLELDQIVNNYDREEQIRQAENKAKVAAVNRSESLKDAENEVVIYGTKVVGVAKADAEAEKYKTEQEKLKTEQAKSQQEARRAVIDNDLYEAEGWVKVAAAKQKVELDAEAARQEIRSREDAERARTIKGLSAVELAAWTKDGNVSKDMLEYAHKLLQRDMSPEQLLAALSGESANSADALKAMYTAKQTSKEEALHELLDEVRKMYGDSLGRDDRMMERYTQLMDRLSGMMTDTAMTAAKRPDTAPVIIPPAAPVQPTQQIIK